MKSKTRTPRLLFVSHTGNLSGGAERSLAELVAALVESGDADAVVCVPTAGSHSAWLRTRGVDTMAIGQCPWWARMDSGAQPWSVVRRLRFQFPMWVAFVRKSVTATRALRDAIETYRPDLVVTNTSVLPHGALAAALCRVPHVWMVREFREPVYLLGRKATFKLVGRLSKLVIANSEFTRSLIQPLIPSVRCAVLHPSITTPSHYTPDRTATSGRPLRLLLLGRQGSFKGTDLAVRALETVSRNGARACLRMVGPCDAGYRSHIRRTAAGYGISLDVEFVEWVDDVTAEIDACDVGLVCSAEEPFGRVAIEYMRRGKPVVAADGGAAREYVADGVNGILFVPGDHSSLAETIGFLDANREVIQRLGRNAFEYASGRFTPEAQAKAATRLLDQVLGERVR